MNRIRKIVELCQYDQLRQTVSSVLTKYCFRGIIATMATEIRGGMSEQLWFHQDALIVRSLRRDENIVGLLRRLDADTVGKQVLSPGKRARLEHELELLLTYGDRHQQSARLPLLYPRMMGLNQRR